MWPPLPPLRASAHLTRLSLLRLCAQNLRELSRQVGERLGHDMLAGLIMWIYWWDQFKVRRDKCVRDDDRWGVMECDEMLYRYETTALFCLGAWQPLASGVGQDKV
jgi:hypothetical protein